jgi:hypothetical protein
MCIAVCVSAAATGIGALCDVDYFAPLGLTTLLLATDENMESYLHCTSTYTKD